MNDQGEERVREYITLKNYIILLFLIFYMLISLYHYQAYHKNRYHAGAAITAHIASNDITTGCKDMPADNRELNYDKNFTEGNVKRAEIEEFNSGNTHRLNLEKTKAKIASLEYIKRELSGEGNLVK